MFLRTEVYITSLQRRKRTSEVFQLFRERRTAFCSVQRLIGISKVLQRTTKSNRDIFHNAIFVYFCPWSTTKTVLNTVLRSKTFNLANEDITKNEYNLLS